MADKFISWKNRIVSVIPRIYILKKTRSLFSSIFKWILMETLVLLCSLTFNPNQRKLWSYSAIKRFFPPTGIYALKSQKSLSCFLHLEFPPPFGRKGSPRSRSARTHKEKEGEKKKSSWLCLPWRGFYCYDNWLLAGSSEIVRAGLSGTIATINQFKLLWNSRMRR